MKIKAWIPNGLTLLRVGLVIAIALLMTELQSSLSSKIGALLIKKPLKAALKDYDLEKYGGAPMLGLNGLVVKTHGSAKAVEVKNSILQCVIFKEMNVSEKIRERLSADNQ